MFRAFANNYIASWILLKKNNPFDQRYLFGLVSVASKLFLFGGSASTQASNGIYFNDIWKYELNTADLPFSEAKALVDLFVALDGSNWISKSGVGPYYFFSL
jgi:hypothetical protein